MADSVQRRRVVPTLVVLAVTVLVVGCAGRPVPPERSTDLPAPAAPPEVAPPAPVTVPLTLEGGAPRLVARVEIGGAVLRVVVDTGSSGLRVPAGTVPPGAVSVDGPARPYAYASGLRLAGRLAHGPVRLGPASGAAVPLELVDTTTCTAAHPDCGAVDGASASSMGGRLDGILGISPQPGPDLPGPLWSLGPVGRAFAVHVDPGGSSALVLGASADGFALEPLDTAERRTTAAGPPAWSARVPMCVGGPVLPTGPVCLPTLFDTGTPPLANIHPPGAAPSRTRPGMPVTLGTPDGHWSTTVVAGDREANVGPPTTPGTDGTTTLGLPAFEHTDVRFDLAGGTLGLRAR